MQHAALICHASTPCRQIDRVEVRVRENEGASLSLSYTVEGELSGLRIPGLRPPSRAERLWQHTCLEAFLSVPDSSGYYEFNFAPSTEWAVYRFDAYREGMTPVESIRIPELTVRCDRHRFELDTCVALDDLSMIPPGASLTLGLSAVIEETGGACSFWAVRHPPGKPDFHHPDSFALMLPRR